MFMSLEEAAQYLYSEEIDADILALPPEVDELTDEEFFNDDDIGNPIVADIAGSAEIFLAENDTDGDKEEFDSEDDLPLASLRMPPNKKVKIQKEKKKLQTGKICRPIMNLRNRELLTAKSWRN